MATPWAGTGPGAARQPASQPASQHGEQTQHAPGHRNHDRTSPLRSPTDAGKAGRRAFSRTAPVTQRYTGDRHHLQADLRSGPSGHAGGLRNVHGPRMVRAARCGPASRTLHADAGAEPGVAVAGGRVRLRRPGLPAVSCRLLASFRRRAYARRWAPISRFGVASAPRGDDCSRERRARTADFSLYPLLDRNCHPPAGGVGRGLRVRAGSESVS